MGREVTARSDIFALGLVIYELFTGRRAFTATTVAELVSQHENLSIAPPSSVVTALDPAIERAILRCLEAEPDRRPASALAVSAALPGGDPLAAALAAGETPSPEMVAAAGEGAGLSARVAWPVFLAVLAGIAGAFGMALRTSPLDRMRPEYTTEVLAQKARDAVRQLVASGRPDAPARRSGRLPVERRSRQARDGERQTGTRLEQGLHAASFTAGVLVPAESRPDDRASCSTMIC